jgi:hypothetical protein
MHQGAGPAVTFGGSGTAGMIEIERTRAVAAVTMIGCTAGWNGSMIGETAGMVG